LDEDSFSRTQGSVLKSFADTEKMKAEGLSKVLEEAASP
jgi:hypothetical protein